MIVELTIKLDKCNRLVKKIPIEKTNNHSEAIERVKLEWLTNYINRDRHPTQKSYPENSAIALRIAKGVKIKGKVIN